MYYHSLRHLLIIAVAAAIIAGAPTLAAQASYFSSARVDDAAAPTVGIAEAADTVVVPADTVMGTLVIPEYFFIPAIYDHYTFPDTTRYDAAELSGNEGSRWIEEQVSLGRRMIALRRTLLYAHPELVSYNTATLLKAPKQYYAVINPKDYTLDIREGVTAPAGETTLQAEAVKKRHWIKDFNVGLQFSQAYISPNWYQGGNQSLIALGSIYYNVKLNQEYHPKLLFETTMQYKLGTNHTPEDTLHSYTVTEDLLQINSTFGVKAAKRWYYSISGQFKTQLLNSYKTNNPELQSAFLSPGDLTVGLGMTYNYARKDGRATFDASISPLSYNLRICTNSRVNAGNYDIEPGRHCAHKIGSSTELKLLWKLTYNITLTSRLFAFTDYHSAQVDWESTLAFAINKFLSTQIYAHLRYDTMTPDVEGTKWRNLQVKEIFSIGFSYSFKSI